MALESEAVRSVRRARRPLVALVALVAALAVGYGVRALGSDDGGSGSASASVSASATGPATSSASSRPSGTVALSSLPSEVAVTIRLIRQGGPFPYPHNDGVVFHNNEHRLPAERDGFYREYTVPTPGSDDRGARRVITGADGRYWYTGDHYETFERVDVTR